VRYGGRIFGAGAVCASESLRRLSITPFGSTIAEGRLTFGPQDVWLLA
jgi:hypothetical protein